MGAVPASPQPIPEPASSALAELRGLLHVARAMRSGGGLEPLLETIARVIGDSLGYGAVVVNLYRPAFDDYEVAVMHGGVEARDFLLGTTTEWDHWKDLLDPRFERHGAYLIPHGAVEWPTSGPWFVPDLPAADGPDAWHAEDALLVPLRASDGALLGILSIDEPFTGRRPGDHQLEVLGAVAAHAAVALEHAQSAEESARHRAAVEHLLRVSSQLSTRSARSRCSTRCASPSATPSASRRSCSSCPSRRAASSSRSPPRLAARGARRLPAATLEELAPLLDPALQREGCILLEPAEALPLVPPALHGIYASSTNGRGPLAWAAHWLVVPLHDPDGNVVGADLGRRPRRPPAADHRAPPGPARLRQPGQRRGRVRAPARGHAPPGRARPADRAAQPARVRAARPRRAAQRGRRRRLLVCDLDNFKRVNDSLGHEAGDEVLRRFADVLRKSTRGTDVPTRLGGEEFASCSPAPARDEALAVAERLRRAVRGPRSPASRPRSRSRSASPRRRPSWPPRADLMRAANRALYAAKRLGRDRVVPYHAETLSLLDDLRDAGGASDEQLAAAMLLAETLDLRDVGTARHSQTVGRLRELIARELGWYPAPSRAPARGGRAARHRQARHLRHDPAQAGQARRRRVGGDPRATPRSARGSSSTPPEGHRGLGPAPPRAHRRPRLPRRPRGRRDPASRPACSPWPTPTRR